MNDGLIEIVAVTNIFKSMSKSALHMNGSWRNICQCKSAVIKTSIPIPMKVDGEPCLMHNLLHRCIGLFDGLHLSWLGPRHPDHQEPEHHRITRMQIQSRIATHRCMIETCICGAR